MSLDAEMNALCEAQKEQWRKEAKALALTAHRLWTEGAFKADEDLHNDLRCAFECLRHALEDVTGWKVSIDFRQRGGARCKS